MGAKTSIGRTEVIVLVRLGSGPKFLWALGYNLISQRSHAQFI